MDGGLPPQFVAWGSFDQGKPRVRLILNALRAQRRLAGQVNIDIWRGIEDKSVAGFRRVLLALLHLVVGYPAALMRLAAKPREQVILLLYPAVIDIFIVWPLARLRSQTIVFDAFVSIHDTVVGDREMLRRNGVLARLLWKVEHLALMLADWVIVDTDEHGDFFASSFRLPRHKFVTALVGAERLFWDARDCNDGLDLPADIPPRYVLFYGQLIPLHGIQTILDAVARTESLPIHWLIVGSGQEEGLVREFVARRAPKNMTWLPWVGYDMLPCLIRRAWVCLGIFGAGEKAARVIPNKMFQVLAAGGTIITRESPAVARLASQFPHTIGLVTPGDGCALAEAVAATIVAGEGKPMSSAARCTLSPEPGLERLILSLQSTGAWRDES